MKLFSLSPPYAALPLLACVVTMSISLNRHAEAQTLTWEGDNLQGVAAFDEANWTGPDEVPGPTTTPVANGTLDPNTPISFNLLVETSESGDVYGAVPAAVGPVNGILSLAGGFGLTVGQEASWIMNTTPDAAQGGFVIRGTSAQDRSIVTVRDNAFMRAEFFLFVEVNLQDAADLVIDSPTGLFNQSTLSLASDWTGTIEFLSLSPSEVGGLGFIGNTTIGGEPAVEGENFQLVSNDAGGAIWSLIADPFLGGDYNGDGMVDAADYTVWRDNEGETFDLPNENPAALTPGFVDAEDYTFWRSQFGESNTTTVAAAAAAPEPMAATLLVAALGLLAHGRRP